MSPREILELEVSLMLMKYGKEALLRGIARRLSISEEMLDSELENLLRASLASPLKKKNTPKPFILDSVLTGNREKDNYLRQLYLRFENRTFLAELKDVKRFFDRYERSVSSLKSRSDARASLFKFLSEFNLSELTKLLNEAPSGKDISALGLISDEILGRSKK